MIYYIYLLVSLLLFVFSPEEFSPSLCISCALIFVLHFYRVITIDNRLCKFGSITFNVLFSLSAFAVIFVFPLLIYGTSKDYSFRALSIFNESAINKVTALSTFGYSLYLISYEHYLLASFKQSSYVQVRIRLGKAALFISKLLAILFVIAFTINLLFFTRTVDSTHNDLSVNTYIAELTKCFLTICLLFCCEKYKYSIKDNANAFFRIAFVPIVCFLLIMLEYLYIGDRGFVIVGGFTLLFIYGHYVKRIKSVIAIPTAIVAIVIMSLVGQLRKSDASLREGGLSSFVTASSEIVGSSNNTLDFISDLTLVSNVAYLEWDYSLNTPLYKPERILILLTYPIPMAPSILSSVLYNERATSISTGSAVTNYYNSQITNAGEGGLGTQLIMDLYMSWRLVGVVIGMGLLGLFLGKANVFRYDNIYYLILLLAFYGLAIYLPRSTVYVCFRTIVWEILIIAILTKIEKVRVKR